MNCREVKQLLSEFLDKHLDSVRAEQVRLHLLSCMECGDMARAHSDLSDALGLMESVNLSQDFKMRFWSKVHASSENSGSVWERLREIFDFRRFAEQPAFTAACVVVACILGTVSVVGVMAGKGLAAKSSPIIEWAQGADARTDSGGLHL